MLELIYVLGSTLFFTSGEELYKHQLQLLADSETSQPLASYATRTMYIKL